jgi:hypothetical protein
MNDYKLIIAGSRGWTDRVVMEDHIRLFRSKFIEPGTTLTIISGTARGADLLGERIAYDNHVRVHRMPADWATWGKRAGFIRNGEMAEIANGCLVCWDGQSKGSLHMWNLAQNKGLDCMLVRRIQPPPVIEVIVSGETP